MNGTNILDQLKAAWRNPNNAVVQLIIINAFIFILVDGLLGLIFGQNYIQFREWFELPSLVLPDPQIDSPALLYQPWSLFTYMFLHFDFWHLLGNMMFLFFFGRVIQEFLGAPKVISLYVMGGLAGGLVYIILYNTPLFDQYGLMQGASAGVFAIVVAAATFVPQYRFHLMFIGPVRIVYIAIFYVGLSLFRVQQVGYGNVGGELAHLGGAALGYFYIVQLRQQRDIGIWVHTAFDWIKSLFKPKSRIRVTYRNPNPKGTSTRTRSSSRGTSSRASAPTSGSGDTTSQAEIDAILDKISDKGYESLSKEEKQKLFNASNQG